MRDYIHVSDLADAHVLGLKYLKSGGPTEVFNLGNGSGFSVQQVIDTAGQVAGRKIGVQMGARRPGDPATLVGSAERAREILGWQPRFADLQTIVRTAWTWHQKRFGS